MVSKVRERFKTVSRIISAFSLMIPDGVFLSKKYPSLSRLFFAFIPVTFGFIEVNVLTDLLFYYAMS